MTIKFAVNYKVTDEKDAIATAAALRDALLPCGGTINLDSEYQEGKVIKQQVALEPGVNAVKGWNAIQEIVGPRGFSYEGDTRFIEGWCLNVGDVIDHLSQLDRSEAVVSANGKPVIVWQYDAVQLTDEDCECYEYSDLFNEQGERCYQEEKPEPTATAFRKATTAFAKAIYKTDKQYLYDLFFGTTHDHMECEGQQETVAILHAKVQLVAYLSDVLHTREGRHVAAMVNSVVAAEQIIDRLFKDSNKAAAAAIADTLPMTSP